MSPDTESTGRLEKMGKVFQLSVSHCFIWQLERDKIEESEEGEGRSGGSGQNRDEVHTTIEAPQKKHRESSE